MGPLESQEMDFVFCEKRIVFCGNTLFSCPEQDLHIVVILLEQDLYQLVPILVLINSFSNGKKKFQPFGIGGVPVPV